MSHKRTIEVAWLRRLLSEMTRRNKHLLPGDNYFIAVQEIREELKRKEKP